MGERGLSYLRDKEYEEARWPMVRDALARDFGRLAGLRADQVEVLFEGRESEMDLKGGVDVTVLGPGLEAQVLALRIRRPKFWGAGPWLLSCPGCARKVKRQFTIRYRRRSGAVCEWQRVAQGRAGFLHYGIENRSGGLIWRCLADFDVMRPHWDALEDLKAVFPVNGGEEHGAALCFECCRKLDPAMVIEGLLRPAEYGPVAGPLPACLDGFAARLRAA